jgi:hypothetical protein
LRSHRIAQRRAARAERQGVDLFNAKPFGPEPPVIRSATGEFRQIVRWDRRHYWAVQAVLVATALTLTVLALVGQVASGHGLESVNVHVTTQVVGCGSRNPQVGDQACWFCGESLEHIPALFFCR